MERLKTFIDTLAEQPMGEGGHEAQGRALAEPLPESGVPFDDLLKVIFEDALPGSFNTTSPGYLAYIPSGGLLHAGVADLIANTINRYVGAWYPSPGLVQIESNVVCWFCEMVGYPKESGGFLTAGGSPANQTAVTTARYEKLGEEFLDGTVYVSDQIHHSVLKAASLAGIRASHVRMVRSDETFRLCLEDLQQKIAEDREAGRQPFMVAASGGTTNSGAVDDLNGVADIAEREGLWMHVDAAYGGFFVLTERGREVLRGLERADSITLDPHKSLFLPYGVGSILVRDVSTLKRTHTVHADYLPPMQSEPDLVDFCEISPELSRDFRGLRVWVPLKMHGAVAFRQALDEKLDLTHYAVDALRQMPGIEILAEPQLSLFAFAFNRPEHTTEELDELNRELMTRVNLRQRVSLAATNLAGRLALRICVLSFRTHRDRIDMCLDDIRAAIAELEGLALDGGSEND